MALFDGRAQYPIPDEAKLFLKNIPEDFIDDGCTNSPDSIFGFNLSWACRIHDARYCTRMWPHGTMTETSRGQADTELRNYIRGSLPFRWRWAGWIYHYFVWRYGDNKAYNTCGIYPEGMDPQNNPNNLCRHNLSMPSWMKFNDKV